jgi:hypothetical protein
VETLDVVREAMGGYLDDLPVIYRSDLYEASHGDESGPDAPTSGADKELLREFVDSDVNLGAKTRRVIGKAICEALVDQADDKFGTPSQRLRVVMIIGHNDGLERAAKQLCRRDDDFGCCRLKPGRAILLRAPGYCPDDTEDSFYKIFRAYREQMYDEERTNRRVHLVSSVEGPKGERIYPEYPVFTAVEDRYVERNLKPWDRASSARYWNLEGRVPYESDPQNPLQFAAFQIYGKEWAEKDEFPQHYYFEELQRHFDKSSELDYLDTGLL